jgi:hypothetical protein
MASVATLAKTPALPAERFFRASLFLLLLSAILTLIGTGKIDLFTSITATVVLLYRARRWWYGHEPELSSRTATFLVLCYLLFFPIDMFFISRALAANSPNPPLYAALISSVHFLIFVMLVRLYSAVSDRDATFLTMLAFAGILAAAVLTVDTTFLFCFFAFLIFGVATFTGIELRRAAEGAQTIPAAAGEPARERTLNRLYTPPPSRRTVVRRRIRAGRHPRLRGQYQHGLVAIGEIERVQLYLFENGLRRFCLASGPGRARQPLRRDRLRLRRPGPHFVRRQNQNLLAQLLLFFRLEAVGIRTRVGTRGIRNGRDKLDGTLRRGSLGLV